MGKIVSSQEFRTTRPRMSLDGRWRFSYDPDGRGEDEEWFADISKLHERIAVPGCSQTRRFKSASSFVRDTDVALPEHSATILLKNGCMHPSWYGKRFTVPPEWSGKEVWLHIGGVKPAAGLWVNGHKLGETATSRSPVRCNLTPYILFGEENALAVRVHWPELRLDGVFDIFYAWSGIYRSVWVEAAPKVHLADLHVVSSIRPRPSATVNLSLRGKDAAGRRLRVVCKIAGLNDKKVFSGEAEVSGDGAGEKGSIRIDMPGARLWSPESPHLYRADVRLFAGDEPLDEGSVRFGLREIRVDGFKVVLNDRPIFLRGGCDLQTYPHTICPPADKAFFIDRIRKAKHYGFNYTKSCVDVYTKEFLDAADELGYLVCQEMPFGLRAGHRARRQDPTGPFAALWRRELQNIVVSDRNHPCVAVYSMASELSVLRNRLTFSLFSREFPRTTRALNPGALIFDATHAGTKDVKTRFGRRSTDLLEEILENADPHTPLQGPLPGIDDVTLPFVLHEYNWITSLPDPELVERYRELPLVPLQIPEMVKAARASGLGDELLNFVKCSRKLKAVLRKDALELAREHPKVAGYHHWTIHDLSYCPQGVFNEFWEPPADLSAEEFRTYNDDTVLVLDDRDQRCFTYGQAVPLGIQISHFGQTPLTRPVLRWRLRRRGRDVARGEHRPGPVRCGALLSIQDLGIRLPADGPAATGELFCELLDGEKRICWNHWNLWLFPAPNGAGLPGGISVSLASLPLLIADYPKIKRSYHVYSPPPGTRVLITDRLENSVVSFLANGGRVVLLSRGVLRERPSCRYKTIPVNYGDVGNMGTVIRPHPVMKHFPHDGWCDLAFVSLIEGAFPMDLSVYRPQRINPIIRSIGHPLSMEDKAYLFEVGVGKGVLLACSLNLSATYSSNPAARHLVFCMIEYMAGKACAPETTLSPEHLEEARSMRPSNWEYR